jgi:hypothetical protein
LKVLLLILVDIQYLGYVASDKNIVGRGINFQTQNLLL